MLLNVLKKWKKKKTQNLYKISPNMNNIFSNSITQKYIKFITGQAPFYLQKFKKTFIW